MTIPPFSYIYRTYLDKKRRYQVYPSFRDALEVFMGSGFLATNVRSLMNTAEHSLNGEKEDCFDDSTIEKAWNLKELLRDLPKSRVTLYADTYCLECTEKDRALPDP